MIENKKKLMMTCMAYNTVAEMGLLWSCAIVKYILLCHMNLTMKFLSIQKFMCISIEIDSYMIRIQYFEGFQTSKIVFAVLNLSGQI